MEQLRTSNEIVQTLRTRNEVHRLEAAAKEVELQKLQEERKLAQEQADADFEGKELTIRTLMVLLSLTVLAVVVYCWWSWCVGPEMSYIRERRRAVFLE
jgi:uncharacterized membrane protein (DUF106 family)